MAIKRTIRNRKLLIVGADISGDETLKTLTAFAWTVQAVENIRDAFAGTAFTTPVILTESTLPDGSWRDVVDLTRNCGCPPRVIVTSRVADERLWAEVLNLGAFDLLVQPVEVGPLIRTVEAAFRDFEEQSPAGLKKLARALSHELKAAIA